MTLLEQANTLAQTGQLNEAIALYDAVLAEDPQNAPAWCNRGNPLHDLGRLGEALESFERAIAINPAHYQSYCNKGVALLEAMRFEEALAAFDQCLAIAPDFALGYSNRGNAHRALHAYEKALADYVRATELDPTLVSAHWNESTCRLHMGDYDLGWKKHEWRWQTDTLKNQTENTPRTTWKLGDPIAGKSFTIWPEGGYGDAIQFTRFAYNLRDLGAKVTIAAPEPLYKLFQDSFKDFEILLMIDYMKMPQSDYHCSILSLPMLCGITSLDKVTTRYPYIYPDLAKSSHWNKWINQRTNKIMRIGLSWAGNPKTGNDQLRSLQFSQLLPVLNVCQRHKVQAISLQKGYASTQLINWSREQGNQTSHALDLSEQLETWTDTAAVVSQLDLVITTCTAIAHLAGAMGKPTWVLLGFNAYWGWLADRADSPWYPCVKLFRQPTFGDWETVMQEVSSALTAKCANT